MNSTAGRRRFRSGFVGIGVSSVVLASCGTGLPNPLPTPRPPSTAIVEPQLTSWMIRNDSAELARLEIRGEVLHDWSIRVLPHTWTVISSSRGHVDGLPDLTAHLLDEACRDVATVAMVEWEGHYAVVVAPDRTLSVVASNVSDDPAFNPPRSTNVPTFPEPVCTPPSVGPSPSG
jgi:hypothetical protein